MSDSEEMSVQAQFDLMHEIAQEIHKRKQEFLDAEKAGKSTEELNTLATNLTNEVFEKFIKRTPVGIQQDHAEYVKTINESLAPALRPKAILRLRDTFLAATLGLYNEMVADGMKPSVTA